MSIRHRNIAIAAIVILGFTALRLAGIDLLPSIALPTAVAALFDALARPNR